MAGLTVVVGDVMDDVVVRPAACTAPDTDTPADITHGPGGSAANQAAWLAHLDVPVRLAARVGAADAPRLTAALGEAGVDARLAADPVRATGTVVVVVAGDRRDMFTDRGANRGLGPTDLPPSLLEGSGHLHVSAYCLTTAGGREGVSALVAAARRAGSAVTVDPASASELAAWPGGPSDLLAPIGQPDVVVPNLAEGRLLTAFSDPDDVVRSLVGWAGLVALKLGPAGVLVGCGRKRWRLAAPDVPVVDPTGAGDAFAAGLLARWREGASPGDCAEAGLSAAAVAVGQVGARPPVG